MQPVADSGAHKRSLPDRLLTPAGHARRPILDTSTEPGYLQRAMDSSAERRRFSLLPTGPRGRLDAPNRLAQLSGVLSGRLDDHGVCTWLERASSEKIALMWPAEFEAFFDPLEIVDETGAVIGRAGEVVQLVGGFLPDGHQGWGAPRIFSARRVEHRTSSDRLTDSRPGGDT